MIIFALETSCDETAAAIVEDGTREISSVLATSEAFHQKTGGIVPEVAARKQVETVIPVIEETLTKAVDVLGVSSTNDVINKIDAVAATVGPGLIGSLIVGVEAAKALALAWNKPLVPVNHLVGHIYGNFVGSQKEIIFPAIALIVSGGHTDLVLMRGHNDLTYLGGTLDDAAGEAFDKTARLLGIKGYYGGKALSDLAATCKENTILGKLPRPMLDKDGFDFSFSGLKTAVRNLVEKSNVPVEVISKEFEDAVVDVLVAKTLNAAHKYNVSSILLAGGVSANSQLRTRMELESGHFNLHVPPIHLCTDNAIYIASAAFFNFNPKPFASVKADPSLSVMDKA
ncbi:MAG: tRNA (adenosine(37)-N6)-threonylcarbamoyltransferase complex transferase subunit TsaD [Patescibacteria group bacterium]